MLSELLRHYQDLNTETLEHDCPRSLREYGRLLDISHAALIQIYSGQRMAGGKVIRGLLRAFPGAAADISRAIAAKTPEALVADETEVAV